MVKHSRKNILLLTATVSPKGSQQGLTIKDPDQRQNEYYKSLKFYVRELIIGTFDGIVFCENSNFSLNSFRHEFDHPLIEWLSYPDDQRPDGFHRGYGEFLLIEWAFRDSKILSSLDATDVIWKISGRYILKNASSFVDNASEKFDLYCRVKNGWGEMSVIAWSVRGYKNFIQGVWPQFSSGLPPEMVLAKQIDLVKNTTPLLFVLAYIWPPYLIGRRGTGGSSYEGRFGIRFFLAVCSASFKKLKKHIQI